MIIKKENIFNLMDTNGRRHDVLNALKIYLEILQEIEKKYPSDCWQKYPKSISQIYFYERAVMLSKDVFTSHKNYIKFLDDINDDHKKLYNKDKVWIEEEFPKYAKVIDESIEKRARHYTNNLVKIGFTTPQRNITQAGYAFLNKEVSRDDIETILPLDNTNIALIRQLMKLKIFSHPDKNNKRRYYSPFLMAIYLLLKEETIDKNYFTLIIQGLHPYLTFEQQKRIMNIQSSNKDIVELILGNEIILPKDLEDDTFLDDKTLTKYLKTAKAKDETLSIYYEFYFLLRTFLIDKNEDNFKKLKEILIDKKQYLNKAFGYGQNIFDIGIKGNFSLDEFLTHNKQHEFLKEDDFNRTFYTAHILSKKKDILSEYSDTTVRLFSASGLFKFKGLPELAYKDLIKIIFSKYDLNEKVFGIMTEEEFNEYESREDSLFYKDYSILDILNYNKEDKEKVIIEILDLLNLTDIYSAKTLLKKDKNTEFSKYIKEKYTKEKVVNLLELFSDRNNDKKIKNEVSEAAPVPTIYEYIIAIAWHHISNFDFDLYDSMNLTLNADFEPVIHAGGGDGDIIIKYEDMIIMLEVTLMNKNAQKRGEWEPVLRHSLNLKAKNEDKDTLTFFVADELDINTINIWRAVAAAPLESTSNKTHVDGVTIMPFTNSNLIDFLEKDVEKDLIVEATKKSFSKVPKITDKNWYDDILSNIIY